MLDIAVHSTSKLKTLNQRTGTLYVEYAGFNQRLQQTRCLQFSGKKMYQPTPTLNYREDISQSHIYIWNCY